MPIRISSDRQQAWEPSSVWKLNFLYKSKKTKLRTFPLFYNSPQYKFEANRSNWVMSYDRTYKHTKRRTEITTLHL